MSLIKM